MVGLVIWMKNKLKKSFIIEDVAQSLEQNLKMVELWFSSFFPASQIISCVVTGDL